jgi:hypothetical protein
LNRASTIPRTVRVGVAALFGLALLAWGGDALAKAPPPKAKELSAISQYRESIPTPAGPTFPTSGPSNKTPLPPPVEQKVTAEGGSDAPVLERVATEENLGAPQLPLPHLPQVRGRVVDERGVPGAVFSGAGKLITDGRNGHLIGLAVVLALLALGAAAAGLLRRRAP